MLNDFKKNIYSQNGEDGILQELLKKLNLDIVFDQFFYHKSRLLLNTVSSP